MELEEDVVPISALQHFLYCPRQCALIHIEQVWSENRSTAEGRVMHARVESQRSESRRGVRIVTAMPVHAPHLGIAGVADAVEFHRSNAGERAYPIEYKRGKPKAHRADEVQLCAQALCLEHMLGTQVVEGALFYGQIARRQVVLFDSELRELTMATIAATRNLFQRRLTPLVEYEPRRCCSCSLLESCLPKLTGTRKSVSDWLREHWED